MVVKEKKDINDFVDKQYELVPPDGGWGYLVATAAAINFMTTTSFIGCFGMMYNEFLIEQSMNSASMTTMSGIYCMSGALAGMLWSKSFIALMIYITLVGASHCTVSILVPLVVADAVDPSQFTAALGILMMLSGLLNLVLGPAIGAVKELSDSYGPCFYLIASCFAIIVLFWSIELCYKKNKHKRLQRKEYLRQKKLNK